LPVVSKRLGHSNPNITLALYSHALEVDEVAAVKLWNDAMNAASKLDPGFPKFSDERAS
jgi:hypothetical protein